MAYEAALSKAWAELGALSKDGFHKVRFLNDEYEVDVKNKHTSAKEFLSVLILHYLIKKLKGLAPLTGEWISFRELEGGQWYYSAFKRATIDRLLQKYGSSPDDIIEAANKLGAKQAEFKDVSVTLEPFDGIRLAFILTRGDEEFAPSANILFDKNIKSILCTEDVSVMTALAISKI